jgi:hypothetical protein
MWSLTDEIIIEICKYLSDKELCMLSQCCKLLRRVSEDNSLWQVKWKKYEKWWGNIEKRGNSLS